MSLNLEPRRGDAGIPESIKEGGEQERKRVVGVEGEK